MAKRSIQRWFQFGILDLLILIAVAAVVMALYRPVKAQQSRDLIVNLSARLRALFADETRSYQQRLRDATHEVRRVALDRAWSDVEAALRQEGVTVVGRERQYVDYFRVIIDNEGWIASDRTAHTLFVEFSVDRRTIQQVETAKPGYVDGAYAGLLVEINRPHSDVLSGGTYPKGSVLYQGLRAPEVAQAATGYPILKSIEVTYDFIRDHHWPTIPQGFDLWLTFGDSMRDQRRGKSLFLTANSGLDPEQDWDGRNVQESFSAEDTIGHFWKWGGSEW